MAPTSTASTTKVSTGSLYQLDQAQTLKASTALLKHIKSKQHSSNDRSTKRNLLAVDGDTEDQEDAVADEDDVPVWLVVTTKKHIIDKKRLKPGKIKVPHSLNASPTSTICLITADPQRPFKDAIAHPSFPADLRPRITRVIGFSKLRTKYKSYESRRQLLGEHDVFLADDRVITLLPNILGKAFYKASAKRPVPVNIAGNERKLKDAKVAKPKEDEKSVATPQAIAQEVSTTLSTALVHLSPSTCTSVRVGKASWTPEKVAENIEAVVDGLVERFVAKKWRGVRGLHIKGPNTAALPLWLADELWMEEADVLDRVPAETGEVKAIEAPKKEKKRKAGDFPAAAAEHDAPNKEKKRKTADVAANKDDAPKKEKKKRKMTEAEAAEDDGPMKDKKQKTAAAAEEKTPKQSQPSAPEAPPKKANKRSSKPTSVKDDDLVAEIRLRKEKLARQKAEAVAAVQGEDVALPLETPSAEPGEKRKKKSGEGGKEKERKKAKKA
ncbi:MAG: hypothetical protein M1832_002004 [Thelocarpon impressellum]|nr:MAG: hypothetical protein M1832_002004 [Thelocarpon impressellum]